jgi:hypothetical protein
MFQTCFKRVASLCYGSIHMFQACFKYFRRFRLMLQVIHLDVAKVDLNVAYIAIAIHMFQSIYFKGFIYFRRMLQVFDLNVSKLDLGEHMFQ